ncbi:isochorismatase family protein, partial [Klebsiella pneumoniae]|uniref:isochorismatase family protein n=1 Tax=Klebsiella pneumoniae TaxID=573 RepID=UPI004055619B
EWVHVQLHQQKGMISLSPPTICNSAGISTTGVVLSSVAWASDADYDVRLVQDCCYDPDRDAHEALLRSGFGGRVQVV